MLDNLCTCEACRKNRDKEIFVTDIGRSLCEISSHYDETSEPNKSDVLMVVGQHLAANGQVFRNKLINEITDRTNREIKADPQPAPADEADGWEIGVERDHGRFIEIENETTGEWIRRNYDSNDIAHRETDTVGVPKWYSAHGIQGQILLAKWLRIVAKIQARPAATKVIHVTNSDGSEVTDEQMAEAIYGTAPKDQPDSDGWVINDRTVSGHPRELLRLADGYCVSIGDGLVYLHDDESAEFDRRNLDGQLLAEWFFAKVAEIEGKPVADHIVDVTKKAEPIPAPAMAGEWTYRVDEHNGQEILNNERLGMLVAWDNSGIRVSEAEEWSTYFDQKFVVGRFMFAAAETIKAGIHPAPRPGVVEVAADEIQAKIRQIAGRWGANAAGIGCEYLESLLARADSQKAGGA